MRQTSHQGQHLLSLPGGPQIDQVMQLLHIYRGPRAVSWRLSLVIGSDSEFPWARLAISVGFPVMSITPWLLESLLPLLSRAPQTWPNVRPWLSKFTSISHWRLSDGNQGRDQSKHRGWPVEVSCRNLYLVLDNHHLLVSPLFPAVFFCNDLHLL